MSDLAGKGSPDPVSGLHGDLASVSEKILKAALTEFGCDNCALYLFNPANGEFITPPRFAGAFQSDLAQSFSPPRTEGITRETLAQRYVLVHNVSGHYRSSFTDREEIRSFMAVGLVTPTRRHPFAVLYINFRKVQSSLDRHITRLLAFADDAADELQTAWSRIRVEKIVQIGNTINQNLTIVPDLFTQLVEQVSDTIDTTYSFFLGVTSQTRQTIDLYYKLAGTRGTRLRQELSAECLAAIVERNVLRASTDILPRLGFLIGGHAQSNIFVPLSLRTSPVGFLLVQHIAKDAYNEEDVRILEILGNHVTTALNGIDLFQTLDRLQAVGQVLTTELEIENIELVVAQKIKDATNANLVVLFSYDALERRFHPPEPLVIGDLLAPEVPLPSTYEPGDVPTSTIELREPEFASDATKLGAQIANKLGLPIRRTTSLFQQREKVASAAAVPLRVAGETVGALYLNYREPQSFAGAQTRLIRGLSVFSAIAIKNARLYSRRDQKRRKELEAIRAIDQQLNQSRSLSDVLHAIVTGANEVVQADRASLLLADDGGKTLRVASSVGGMPHDIGRKLPTDSPKGISVWAFRQGAPVLANGVQSDPFWSSLFIDTGEEMHSELDYPLIDNDEVLGVLNFESRRVPAFDADHQEFIGTLAGQVVLAVKKAQAYEEALRRAHEHQRLIGFTRAVARTLDRNEILHLTLEHGKEASRVEAGVIFEFDAVTDDLYAVLSDEFPPVEALPRLPRNRGLIGGQAARMKTTVSVNPRKSVASREELAFLGDFRAVVAAPMYDGTRLWGVLVLGGRELQRFDDSTERVITAIASAAAMAFQSADRYRDAMERRRRMRALFELSQKTILESKDPAEVLRMVVRSALELTRATRSDLDLHDSREELVRTYYCKRDENGQATDIVEVDLVNNRPLDLARGIMAKVAREKQPYLCAGDAFKDPHYKGIPGIHSEVAVPLLARDQRLVGVLNLESIEFNAFTEDDVELLKLFADEAVLAMEITNSQAMARRELDRFTALLTVGEALSALSATQRDDAYRIVATEASKQCACFTVIRVYDDDAKHFREVITAGTGAPPFSIIPKSDTVYRQIFKSSPWQAVMIPDLHHPPPEFGTIRLSDHKSRSLMVAPVYVGEAIYGSIGMSDPRPHAFTEPDMSLIRGLARLLAVTLQRMDSALRESELLERSKHADIMTSLGDAALDLAHRLGDGLGNIPTRIDFARMELNRGNREAAEKHLTAVTASVTKVISFGQQLKENVRDVTSSDPSTVSIHDIIRDIDKLAAPYGYEVENEITPQSPRVYASPNDVRLILQNLADNAVAAMNGKGVIRLAAQSRGRDVEIVFADNGPGIPERLRPHIFRFGFSDKDSSGWGLFGARKKAIANRGDLKLVDSEVGARFLLTLPRADGEIPHER